MQGQILPDSRLEPPSNPLGYDCEISEPWIGGIKTPVSLVNIGWTVLNLEALMICLSCIHTRFDGCM